MNLLQRVYLRLHTRKFRQRAMQAWHHPRARVISIGNLSAGGTGKTPLGMLLAATALQQGLLTTVLLRGYKAKLSRGGALVRDYKQSSPTEMDASTVGDEALLFASIPGLQVLIGRNRQHALVNWSADSDLVILDDAFQNPSVARDFDIVLIDASLAVTELSLLPCGKFREPIQALSRADCIVLTRCDQADLIQIQEWREQIYKVAKQCPVFQSNHRFGGVYSIATQRKLSVSWSRPVVLLAGIGNPLAFRKTMQQAGFAIEDTVWLKDHELPRPDFLQSLASRYGDTPIVMTEKDYVRLRPLLGQSTLRANRFFYSKIEIAMQNQKEFLERALGNN
ncbi:MAG: tetraacyldisaccharide 4'-kinase [Leptospiraceae bacterium]|nr:tetraacyldisaccharide 4'-kinase [Leptospiraceae bacterium]